ncbi:MAG: aminotransferase class I/II-fold pyridoxal phosphate-dependent enzyme [Acidimicrobiia bacterium]|nr:aminotransferase class I/II-fold pyridoxal phosphate-dependent enzyme [Acidimicrobiia bacterium]
MVLSQRGRKLIESPPMSEYAQVHRVRALNPFHPEHNPDGYIPLCVAENKLIAPMVAERIAAVPDMPLNLMGYQPMTGSVELRVALARFMERSLLGRPVDPEELAVLAGAGSVLEIMFAALCDPGDGVLVPTPSYAGFWADLETRDEITIVPVHCSSENGFELTTELLDRALADADRPIRALLFTSPNNPLGWTYTPDEIAEIVEWAETNDIHLVMDEIYALSVFGDTAFTSAAAVVDDLGDNIHIVWAFSKDFGASGLRAGVLWTRNEELLDAVESLGYWAMVSGHTQHVLADMVCDEGWLDGFVEELRRGLREAHSAVTDALVTIGVPVIPSDAGIFLMCDMRPHMAEVSWRAEQNLWQRILDTTNVNLTPGSACRVGEPGFFRLCFAAVPTPTAVEAIERVGNVL